MPPKRSRSSAPSAAPAAKKAKKTPPAKLARQSTLAAMVSKEEPKLRPVSRTKTNKKASTKKTSAKKAAAKPKKSSAKKAQVSTAAKTKKKVIGEEDLDAEQVRLLQEQVILVDKKDNPTGFASKRDSHRVENIEKGMLHRAFSVFLFNNKNQLLLQQRATEKITFPDMWTNTCCSHPLNIEGETEEKNAMGTKRAAVRKLEHELGIKVGTIATSEFKFMTKIYYKALQDENWGEHEVDHVFLCKQKDTKFVANPNEVRDTKWVTMAQLKKMFKDRDGKKTDKHGEPVLITPWFEMICNKFLFGWWNDLDHALSDAVKPTPPRKVHALKLS